MYVLVQKYYLAQYDYCDNSIIKLDFTQQKNNFGKLIIA